MEWKYRNRSHLCSCCYITVSCTIRLDSHMSPYSAGTTEFLKKISWETIQNTQTSSYANTHFRHLCILKCLKVQFILQQKLHSQCCSKGALLQKPKPGKGWFAFTVLLCSHKHVYNTASPLHFYRNSTRPQMFTDVLICPLSPPSAVSCRINEVFWIWF